MADETIIAQAVAQLTRTREWQRFIRILMSEYNEDQPNHKKTQDQLSEALGRAIRKHGEQIASLREKKAG